MHSRLMTDSPSAPRYVTGFAFAHDGSFARSCPTVVLKPSRKNFRALFTTSCFDGRFGGVATEQLSAALPIKSIVLGPADGRLASILDVLPARSRLARQARRPAGGGCRSRRSPSLRCGT